MGNPTRSPSGISTASKYGTLWNYPAPDPSKVFTDWSDFDRYAAGDWTVTNTTTHATIALAAGNGGILSLAGGASSVTNDYAAIITNPLDVNFAAGKQVWFSCKIKSTNAANDQLLVGITSANSTAAPTDGIYFNKAASSNAVDFVVKKSSTATTQTAVASLVSATYLTLGFYYDGKKEIQVFANDVKVYSQQVLTNLPAGVALGKGAAMKAAAAAPTTSDLLVDWLFAAVER